MPSENYRLTNIERLLPHALKAVEEYLLDKNEKKVPAAYKGYISSFGAGVVLSGLLPTIAIYTERKTDAQSPGSNRSEQDRSKVLDAIWWVMNEGIVSVRTAGQHHPLLKEAVTSSANHHAQRLLIDRITPAAIALKHAMRTYEIDKTKNE